MFEGFAPQTVDFMWGIRFNNEKAWFELHRQEYLDYFYNPMRALGAQVLSAMEELDETLTLRVSRIYRDARRLRGRGPYKDHLWFTLERPAGDDQWSDRPVLWFELGPEEHSFGMGYYYAPPLTMAKFRARLSRDPAPFEKLVRAFNRQKRFQLEGEEYKHPKGPPPSKLLAPWYNRKGVSLTCRRANEGELFTPALARTLTDSFTQLLPFYNYFASLDSDPDPRAPGSV